MNKNTLNAAVIAVASLICVCVAPSRTAAAAQVKDARLASGAETVGKSAPLHEEKKTKAEHKPEKLVATDEAAKSGVLDNARKNGAAVKTIANTGGGSSTSASNGKPESAVDASAKNSSSVNIASPDALLKVANNSNAPALSSFYRVAAGDTLDIRLLNNSSRESTLFTVLSDGTIDYPLAGEPLNVNGLMPEEIAARLVPRIKLYDKPQVTVGVREYASHNVIVTGLVDNPGTKILRREAVPLYVVLAEAQPRLEAARASIVRAGTQIAAVELSNQTQAATLVMPGDFIKVTAAPPPVPQFYFIGGQINAPGQKDFHVGLTLTQAVLASGGATRFAGNKIKVSRQSGDGRLATTEYNLKQIGDGKIPDPLLQPGDRVEVGHGRW